MTKTIEINVEEMLKRLEYWFDKVEDCYKKEVEYSMNRFIKEHGLKK